MARNENKSGYLTQKTSRWEFGRQLSPKDPPLRRITSPSIKSTPLFLEMGFPGSEAGWQWLPPSAFPQTSSGSFRVLWQPAHVTPSARAQEHLTEGYGAAAGVRTPAAHPLLTRGGDDHSASLASPSLHRRMSSGERVRSI